ncbi:MAG TPA: hypothetical protein VFU80_02460 [Sphingomicrobium sp.]|nr:hypothetical protein [Sphingomicrobium sp.]
MVKGRMPYPACGPFLLALLLGACSDQSRPSAAENEQLDNAAEMLDAAPGTLANIDENALGEPERNEIQ